MLLIFVINKRERDSGVFFLIANDFHILIDLNPMMTDKCLFMSLLGLLVWAMSSCGGRLAEVTPAFAEAAHRQWPDVDSTQLVRGRAVLTTRCNTCHGLPFPSEYSAAEWPDHVRSMAKRSKLTAEQETDVLRYVLTAQQWHEPQP